MVVVTGIGTGRRRGHELRIDVIGDLAADLIVESSAEVEVAETERRVQAAEELRKQGTVSIAGSLADGVGRTGVILTGLVGDVVGNTFLAAGGAQILVVPVEGLTGFRVEAGILVGHVVAHDAARGPPVAALIVAFVACEL